MRQENLKQLRSKEPPKEKEEEEEEEEGREREKEERAAGGGGGGGEKEEATPTIVCLLSVLPGALTNGLAKTCIRYQSDSTSNTKANRK